MIFRTAATTAALAVVLAIVGAIAGPQWNPEPVAVHLRPDSDDTTIGGQIPTAPVGTYSVTTTTLIVELDGAQVEATLRRPDGAVGALPGVVFLHGAGTGEGSTAFRLQATDLASAGIVTLVPSKRLDTYTTRHRDYVASAGDYARSVDVLRQVKGVDPARVGLFAESEGTWIAPVLAASDPSIAFTALVSAPVVPPREQAAFAVDSYLRNTNVPRGVFRAIPRAVGMQFPGGGFEYADFNVEPYLRQLTAPVLVVYGTGDESMPVEQGAEQVRAAAAGNGNNAVTVRYYGGANHGIMLGAVLAPGFTRDVAAWIGSLPHSAAASPQVAGAQPNQRFLAERVPTPQWLGDGDVVVGLVVGAVALLILGPLVLLGSWIWNRFRGHADGPQRGLRRGFRMPLVGLGVGSVLTLVALVVYLVAVAQLALNYEKDPWIVQGGWLAVRLAGLATLVPAALLINRAGDLRAARKAAHLQGSTGEVIAAGVPARVTVWCVALGSSSLLVTLAYWGVYQLGI